MANITVDELLRIVHANRTALTDEDFEVLKRDAEFWSWFEYFTAARWLGFILEMAKHPERHPPLDRMQQYHPIISDEFVQFSREKVHLAKKLGVDIDAAIIRYDTEELKKLKPTLVAGIHCYDCLMTISESFTSEEKLTVEFFRHMNCHPVFTSFQARIKGKAPEAKPRLDRYDVVMRIHSGEFDMDKFFDLIDKKVASHEKDLRFVLKIFSKFGRLR